MKRTTIGIMGILCFTCSQANF